MDKLYVLCLLRILSCGTVSVKLTVRIPRELEEEIRWALRVMEEISCKARLERPLVEVIREFRDRRWR